MSVEKKSAVFGNAKYIKAQSVASEFSFFDPAPLFRKEFEWKGDTIKSARMYVQSPGFAYFYLNGKNITEDLFLSPVSNYTKILWYHVYDVTHLLRCGKNVISVIAGNGFLNESFDTPWRYHEAPWRDAPQFILCLEVNGFHTVVSDASWKVSIAQSPIIFNHLRGGEYVDARKQNDDWMYEDYDASEWESAVEGRSSSNINFRRCDCQPIREVERILPAAIAENNGTLLVDFGVTISGYADIRLKTDKGAEIVFCYCEEIDEKLSPKHNQMNVGKFEFSAPFQTDRLIASGGTDSFKPKFSYHGFRYVSIRGLRNVSELLHIEACFIHQDVDRRSSFASGNDILNYIYDAGIRSTYSNMFWNLTDCPTREKLGWANDAQASIEQTLINFDIVPFYERWYEDVKAEMREDGALPGIIPSPGYGYQLGPICDCLLYELPYRIYLYTGDAKMLTDALPYLERYADYLYWQLENGVEFKLGDWLGYANNPLIPKSFVAEVYLLKALEITALATELRGQCDSYRKELLNARKNAFLNKYLNDTDACLIEEQTALAMMLENGLYRNKQVLQEQLLRVLQRDQMQLTCGMVGVQYLYDALSDCGRADLAYRLITESEPGYRTWFEHDATTLWENWDGADNGSHNHHMYSGVIAWFFKSLLGIAPKQTHPGFEEIELRPQFVEQANFVKGSIHTVKGCIKAGWTVEKDCFIYTVEIPKGINANFKGKRLEVGEHQFRIMKGDLKL